MIALHVSVSFVLILRIYPDSFPINQRNEKSRIDIFRSQLPLVGSGKKPKRPYKMCTPSDRCLVHLHIGKNGGSSLDSIGKKLTKKFVGGKHFDWSYIQGMIGMENADVILMLRNPVARSVSHFYFAKHSQHGSHKLQSASLSAFLSDPQFLLEERGIWQDGQAAVSWLTGTHLASWCQVPVVQVKRREMLAQPSPELLHVAAERLEKTVWFGILEDVPRSMELLQHTLQLDFRPELPHRNKRKKHLTDPPPTPEEVATLEYLTPLDHWLYRYGLVLFEARWNAYVNNQSSVVFPARPPYPDIPCWSTRFELHCDRGPLKGNFSLH